MSQLYFTPAAIGYLTQLILCVALIVYLASCLIRGDHSIQTRQIMAFFISGTLFVGLLYLDAVSLPTQRLYFMYLENTALGITLVFLLQFAYQFPEPVSTRYHGSIFALALSLSYTLYELQYAVYRYNLLINQGIVVYRPVIADYALLALLVWVPVAFALQTISIDQRDVPWWIKLRRPQSIGALGARSFALIFIPLLLLAIINLLQIFSFISSTIYAASLSVGILLTIFMFAFVYLNYQPISSTLLGKLSILTLTILLVVLGLVSWVVTPAHIAAYHPKLTDHQTLRYVPNDLGGYDIEPAPFHYETDLGKKLLSISTDRSHSQLVNFNFLLYGREYHEVAVTSMGLLSMGEIINKPNLEKDYGHSASIVPLLVDLDPTLGGGIYIRVEPERLIVTWDHLPALSQPEAIFTFQAILYSDGSFDVTYNGLPDKLLFDPNADPSATPWFRGVTPGLAKPVEQVADLSQAFQSGPQGVVQDIFLDFRSFLNTFNVRLAWLIVGSCLLILSGLPILVNLSLTRPLRALLAGIEQVEGGDLNVEMPIYFNDEIGSLTMSFKSMILHLNSLVTMLEQRVTERTQELQSANQRLLIEIDERAAAEDQIIQQQRDLAAAEERELLGRDLHDGFGQMISYVNIQAQAAQALLEKKDVQAAHENLERIVQTAQQAHLELRHYILGLDDSVKPQRSFYGVLQESLRAFNQAWGIETVFSPAQYTLPILPEMVEVQLLHIIQEALVNIRKHAQARRVEVLVTSVSDELVFMISDDGVGFDPQFAVGVDQKRFGLSSMRERAEQIGGRLEVRSALGQGTRVLVHIPRVLQSVQQDVPGNILGLRVLLADPQPLFLAGMQNLLTSRGLTVIGTVLNGHEMLDQVRSLRPDVVIMDAGMPNCDTVEIIRLTKAECPEVKMVLLIASEDDERLLDAIKYGASGYLLKNLDANQIFSMLSKLVRGESSVIPNLASRMLTEFNKAATASRGPSFREETVPSELTMRQWEVLRLVARGLTYKEVGTELSLTERAIKYHMGQITERLGLKNREQVMAYVRQFQEGRKKKSA